MKSSPLSENIYCQGRKKSVSSDIPFMRETLTPFMRETMTISVGLLTIIKYSTTSTNLLLERPILVTHSVGIDRAILYALNLNDVHTSSRRHCSQIRFFVYAMEKTLVTLETSPVNSVAPIACAVPSVVYDDAGHRCESGNTVLRSNAPSS